MNGMKVPHSNAAGHHFVWKGDDGEGYDPAVPEDAFEVHAILFDPDTPPHLSFSRNWWAEQTARHQVAFLEIGDAISACGKRCRMVFPLRFDTEEPDACPRCLEMVELWLTDRAEYDRRSRAREVWIVQRREDERAMGEEMDRALQEQAADIARRKREQEARDAG